MSHVLKACAHFYDASCIMHNKKESRFYDSYFVHNFNKLIFTIFNVVVSVLSVLLICLLLSSPPLTHSPSIPPNKRIDEEWATSLFVGNSRTNKLAVHSSTRRLFGGMLPKLSSCHSVASSCNLLTLYFFHCLIANLTICFCFYYFI